jgi:hypothetical protein
VTSIPFAAAIPSAYRFTSESASDSQNSSSATRSSTGSFRIPPSGAVMNTYFAWFTAHLWRSRGTIVFVRSNASGPLIWICFSTPTSHRVTSFTRCQYSFTGSP